MPSPTRWCTTAIACLLALSACGDDSGSSSSGLTLSISRPSVSEVLYAGQTVALEAVAEWGEQEPPEGAEITFDWDFGDGATASRLGATTSHSWDEPGSFILTVTAVVRVEGSVRQERSAERVLTIAATPDLVARDATLTLGGSAVRDDDTFRLSGNLQSAAEAVLEPFDVGLYVGLAAAVDATSVLTAADLAQLLASERVFELRRVRFDAFAASPSQAVIDDSTLRMPESAAAGEYVAFLFVDPDDTVAELDEVNNASFASRSLPFERTSGQGPDLVISSVTVQPTLTNVLDAVALGATITNTGDVTTPPFAVTVYLSADNPTLDDADRELTSFSVDGIAPGRNQRIEGMDIAISPAETTLGAYFIIVEVDSGRDVAERSEDNNVAASPRISVTDEVIPGADLVPVAFEVLPLTTFITGTVQVNLAVTNAGDDPVSSTFICRVYLSENDTLEPASDFQLQSLLVDPVAAGDTVEISVDTFVPPITPGTYTPFVFCDPTSTIPESNESNNTRAATPVTVAADANIDLRFGAFTMNPTTVQNGDPVDISVTVCNDGSNGSTPTTLRVHISKDGALDAGDSILLDTRVPPVEPGACVTIASTVAARCDTFFSDYVAFASVDPERRIEEVDESNNVVLLGETFRIESLICACVADDLEPNDSPFVGTFLDPDVGEYASRTMCDANVDYYYVALQQDDTVRLMIDFDNDRGNLDLQLFATDRATLLDESATNGDREEVSRVRVSRTGNYMVRVSGRTAADRNVYDLSLEVSQPEPGIDFVVLDVTVDPERPVLGDTVEVCFDLVNLGGTTAPASTVRLHLSEDTTLDPVVDPLLATLDVPSFDARLVRCVDVTIPEDSGGGTRYVAVVADARNDVADELSETNNVSLSPAFVVDSSCFDLLEPNNDPDEPRLIELVAEPPVTLADLLVCSGNSDHYAFCVSDGDYLRLTVTFDPGRGDVDLRLRDGAAEVDRSEGVGGTEQVEVDYVAGDRCYTLDVFVVGEGREVPYALEVDTGVAPEELVCSRAEEPNDDFDTARPLRDFLDVCPAICPVDDTDFYAVVLSAGTEIEVSLVGPDGTPPPSDVRLALFGPSRNFLTSTVTATEVLRHTAALTGEYSLRVRANGAGPRDQPYCLSVDGLSGTDLVPSNFRLETGEAYAGDTVRFSFTLSNALDVASAATTYAVYLSSDAVISPDDTLLRTVELAPLDGLASRQEGRRFDVPSGLVDGGTYRVILKVDDGDVVDELREANNVAIELFEVLPRCVPDAAEPNNFFADAAPASAHTAAPLTSCGQADADWFTFEGSGAETTVAIRFFDADGDLDLYVYEVTESGLALEGFSDSITDDEVVTVDTDAEATYAIEVRQHTDESVTYTLEIE